MKRLRFGFENEVDFKVKLSFIQPEQVIVKIIVTDSCLERPFLEDHHSGFLT